MAEEMVGGRAEEGAQTIGPDNHEVTHVRRPDEKQPGVWYPDDIEVASNMDKHLGIPELSRWDVLAEFTMPIVMLIVVTFALMLLGI